jgi:hypothetical protein
MVLAMRPEAGVGFWCQALGYGRSISLSSVIQLRLLKTFRKSFEVPGAGAIRPS